MKAELTSVSLTVSPPASGLKPALFDILFPRLIVTQRRANFVHLTVSLPPIWFSTSYAIQKRQMLPLLSCYPNPTNHQTQCPQLCDGFLRQLPCPDHTAQ
jgi:hypothetical protein